MAFDNKFKFTYIWVSCNLIYGYDSQKYYFIILSNSSNYSSTDYGDFIT